MIMDTDYGKILIVFCLIVPVRMDLVMVHKPEESHSQNLEMTSA